MNDFWKYDRAEKSKLFLQAKDSLKTFKPLKKEDYANNPIQILDFFSGAGGTSLGFAAINSIAPVFNFLGGCDIDKLSAESYSKNFGTPILQYDVRNLVEDETIFQEFVSVTGYDCNKPLIIIGCSPCQGFSSHRKKDWGKEEDQRNDLVEVFSKLVKKFNPVAIVSENVPELLSQRYWNHFCRARDSYVEMGYTVKQTIYNCAEFYVPQERFRALMLAMKKDFILPEGILNSDDFITVRDAIGDLPPVEAGEVRPEDPMHKSARHNETTLQVIRQVPKNGGSRPKGVGPKCLEKIHGYFDVYGRLFWDKPSITITHYARNPASGRFTHPEQDRAITAREAARLQSFPDGFEFAGKFDDIYRQIGEAVPPLFACAVAINLMCELNSDNPSRELLENGRKIIDTPVPNSYSSLIAGMKLSR